ncbi:MAG TPA: c-type cytochrome domain-containing protein, partial [Caulifigura sp.]|nr:c-type cytochrome domain-containing protein [Caulifigura sp.]
MNRFAVACVTVIAGCLVVGAAAKADPVQPVDPTPDKPADFYVDVYPVLEGKCLACHSRAKHEADLVLEDVPGILKGGASGPAVVAGQPDQSLLFKLCARLDEPAMPPLPNRVGAVALTPAELGRLRRWITEGAQPGKMNPSAAAIGWQALPSTMTSSFALALGPQDRFVAVSRANVIAVNDLITGREIARLGDPLIRTVKTPSQLPLYDREVAHFDVVSSLAFSPDGDLLASGGYREVKIWHRQRNSVAARIETGGPPASISLTPKGSMLLVARKDGTVALWDMEQASEQAKWGPIEGLNHAALLSDGRRAVLSRASGELVLWDVAEKRELKSWPGGPMVSVLVPSPTESSLFTGHADGSIRRWDLPAELGDKPVEPAAVSAATGQVVQRLAVSPDGKQLAAGFADGKVLSAAADLKEPKNPVEPKPGLSVLAVTATGDVAIVTPE